MLTHFPLRGGAFTNRQTIVADKKVTKNAVAKSPAAWLPFDQVSGKFENIGRRHTPASPGRQGSLGVP